MAEIGTCKFASTFSQSAASSSSLSSKKYRQAVTFDSLRRDHFGGASLIESLALIAHRPVIGVVRNQTPCPAPFGSSLGFALHPPLLRQPIAATNVAFDAPFGRIFCALIVCSGRPKEIPLRPLIGKVSRWFWGW